MIKYQVTSLFHSSHKLQAQFLVSFFFQGLQLDKIQSSCSRLR